MRDDAGDLTRRVARFNEVIALVGKVERRFETHGQVEQPAIHARDFGRERPFELVVGGASLERRHRVDEIAHGFGLHQIDPAVQKRAQRELAGFGQARSLSHRRLDDRAKEDRATVGADLDDVLAGVRVRAGEERQDRPGRRRRSGTGRRRSTKRANVARLGSSGARVPRQRRRDPL